MRVAIKSVKTANGYSKYLTLSKGEKSSKAEREVLRSIYLSYPLPQGIGTLPDIKKKPVHLYLVTKYKISDKDYEKEQTPNLPILSAPEMRKAISEDRNKDEELAIDKASRQQALARELGLYKLIPKDLKPKFECRCGETFKRKAKLLRHQRSCQSIFEARELFTLCHIIQEQFKAMEPQPAKVKKAKHESKAPIKKGKTHTRKQPSTPVRSAKRKGQKDSKASKRKTSKRLVNRK